MDARLRAAREAAAGAAAFLRGMRALESKLARALELLPPAQRGPVRFERPPPLPLREVERVLAAAWDEDPAAVLADLEPEPRVLTSFGQVHRAVRAADGAVVSVKVQRSGAAEAIRADLQHVGALARLATALAPGLDVAGLAAEIRERTLEELDHELEAQAQRAFARAYRGHPHVLVPAPDTTLSRASVLVAEWAEGRELAELTAAADRDRAGELLIRFYLGAPYRMGRLNADPHPANWRLTADGRLAVLDFGATQPRAPARLSATARVFDAGHTGDAAAAHAALAELGYLPDPAAVEPEALLATALGLAGWLVADRETTIDSGLVAATAAALEDPRVGFLGLLGRVTLPPEDLQARRVEASLLGVLAQLEPTANWWRIAAEWWRDASPATALGREEQEFWRSRAPGRTAR